MSFIKKILKKPVLYPILTGILLFLCFPNIHIYFLVWIAIVPLFVMSLLETDRLKETFYFFLAAYVFHSLTLNWLIANMFWVGGPAFIGYQCLSIGLSIFWAIFGYLWYKCGSQLNYVFRNYIFGLLWVGMEWTQAHALTGFGWCNLGYSQGPDLLFSQLSSIGSVPFLSFFILVANMFIAEAIVHKDKRWKSIIHVIAIIVIAHLIGVFLLMDTKIQEEEDTKIALIQPCFPQEMKFDPIWYEDMVHWAIQYSDNLISDKTVNAIFWPEALIMSDYSDPEILSLLKSFTHNNSIHLITGTTRIDKDGNDYNSCIWVNPEGEVMDYYDKIHLAPFGEYLPLSQILPFMRNILPYDVSPGKEQKVFNINESIKVGPLICFEVLFTSLAYNLRKEGATLIAILTNLSWFGGTNALPQELEICRMRAIETRLPVIHCTNTGISGLFDPSGNFYPANIIIGKNQTFIYKPLETNPRISIRTRLGGIFKLPEPAPLILPFNPDFLSLFSGILGIVGLLLALILQKIKKGIPENNVS